MALTKLRSAGTYEEINLKAHRKPASVVGTPSLVRVISFWNTERLTPGERIKRYNEYLEGLKQAITSRMEYIRSDPFDLDFGNAQSERGTVNIIKFWWHGIRTTTRLEFNSEYLTLTSIFDLSVKDDVGHNDAILERLIGHFNVLAKSFNSKSVPADDSLQTARNYLCNDIWNYFESSVIYFRNGDNYILRNAFGEVFWTHALL